MPRLRRVDRQCQDCGNRCHVEPTEVQIHRNDLQFGYWEYIIRVLCPPCRRAQLDYWRGQAAATATRDGLWRSHV